jgi:hypothetical protein
MATRQKRKTGPAGNYDYVEHGSDQHAALLGLRKAEEDDTLVYQGWTLADVTTWGPTATPLFLKNILRSKVSELTTPPPVVQSVDPMKPGYAPPMWQPGPGG